MADPGTDLVAALLAGPGVHVGLGRSEGNPEPYVARIVVTPLPGLGGVALDFEAHSASRLATGDAYFEHAMLGRQRNGSTVLVTAHSPGATVMVMTEVEPGRFVSPSAADPSVGVRVEVPEPGTITYAWSWVLPDDGFRERDVATVARIPPTPGR